MAKGVNRGEKGVDKVTEDKEQRGTWVSMISHPHRNRQGQEVLGLGCLEAVGAGPSTPFLLRIGKSLKGIV